MHRSDAATSNHHEFFVRQLSAHGTVAEILKPLAVAGDGTWALLPRYGSNVIDAALDCVQLDDQHDTSRPQGSACDLGAIETDYIFVSEFE